MILCGSNGVLNLYDDGRDWIFKRPGSPAEIRVSKASFPMQDSAAFAKYWYTPAPGYVSTADRLYRRGKER